MSRISFEIDVNGKPADPSWKWLLLPLAAPLAIAGVIVLGFVLVVGYYLPLKNIAYPNPYDWIRAEIVPPRFHRYVNRLERLLYR